MLLARREWALTHVSSLLTLAWPGARNLGLCPGWSSGFSFPAVRSFFPSPAAPSPSLHHQMLSRTRTLPRKTSSLLTSGGLLSPTGPGSRPRPRPHLQSRCCCSPPGAPRSWGLRQDHTFHLPVTAPTPGIPPRRKCRSGAGPGLAPPRGWARRGGAGPAPCKNCAPRDHAAGGLAVLGLATCRLRSPSASVRPFHRPLRSLTSLCAATRDRPPSHGCWVSGQSTVDPAGIAALAAQIGLEVSEAPPQAGPKSELRRPLPSQQAELSQGQFQISLGSPSSHVQGSTRSGPRESPPLRPNRVVGSQASSLS